MFFVDLDLPPPDVQLSPGHSVDPSPSPEAPGPSTSSASKHHRAHRSGGARDERYRSGSPTSRKQRKGVLNKHVLTVSFYVCRHPHRGSAGGTGQAQRGKNGTAHAD